MERSSAAEDSRSLIRLSRKTGLRTISVNEASYLNHGTKLSYSLIVSSNGLKALQKIRITPFGTVCVRTQMTQSNYPTTQDTVEAPVECDYFAVTPILRKDAEFRVKAITISAWVQILAKQIAFHPGRGSIDNTFALRQAFQQHHSVKRPMMIVLPDVNSVGLTASLCLDGDLGTDTSMLNDNSRHGFARPFVAFLHRKTHAQYVTAKFLMSSYEFISSAYPVAVPGFEFSCNFKVLRSVTFVARLVGKDVNRINLKTDNFQRFPDSSSKYPKVTNKLEKKETKSINGPFSLVIRTTEDFNPENSVYTLSLEDEDTNRVITRFGTSASNRTTVYNRILRVNLVVYGGGESQIQFAINITGIPCDFRLTRQSANITWLGTDRWYRSDVCRWIIELPERHYIILNFDDFHASNYQRSVIINNSRKDQFTSIAYGWVNHRRCKETANEARRMADGSYSKRLVTEYQHVRSCKIRGFRNRANCVTQDYTIEQGSVRIDSRTAKHIVDYYERDGQVVCPYDIRESTMFNANLRWPDSVDPRNKRTEILVCTWLSSSRKSDERANSVTPYSVKCVPYAGGLDEKLGF
ncbi:hypothetical protein CLF_110962 [Clonorchis sinensis]|uniref:CUB domain-containing protein n=1 Tax=Clonorchis sinensis TaxID=79923 RepID=G7YU43_CLOSI|nr:hypothetical protein CLF_110962 [Clonorchis sinensis]